jgi:hypothetical protein
MMSGYAAAYPRRASRRAFDKARGWHGRWETAGNGGGSLQEQLDNGQAGDRVKC